MNSLTWLLRRRRSPHSRRPSIDTSSPPPLSTASSSSEPNVEVGAGPREVESEGVDTILGTIELTQGAAVVNRLERKASIGRDGLLRLGIPGVTEKRRQVPGRESDSEEDVTGMKSERRHRRRRSSLELLDLDKSPLVGDEVEEQSVDDGEYQSMGIEEVAPPVPTIPHVDASTAYPSPPPSPTLSATEPSPLHTPTSSSPLARTPSTSSFSSSSSSSSSNSTLVGPSASRLPRSPPTASTTLTVSKRMRRQLVESWPARCVVAAIKFLRHLLVVTGWRIRKPLLERQIGIVSSPVDEKTPLISGEANELEPSTQPEPSLPPPVRRTSAFSLFPLNYSRSRAISSVSSIGGSSDESDSSLSPFSLLRRSRKPTSLECKPPFLSTTSSTSVGEKPKHLDVAVLARPKVLVLDLDETLIHSTSRLGGLGGSSGSGGSGNGRGLKVRVVEVVLDGRIVVYHVYKRPWVDFFLKKVSSWYTVVIFTASMREYADPVIDWLDQGRGIINGRLFRESCTNIGGSYVKDLAIVDSDLSRVCLVDNSPISYGLNQANGIPIEGWLNDPYDEGLLDLLPMLDSLRFTADVRRVLGLRGFNGTMSTHSVNNGGGSGGTGGRKR